MTSKGKHADNAASQGKGGEVDVIDVANGPVSQNTARLVEAFQYAAELTRTSPARGQAVPYISHLMAVAATVIEQGGGTEDTIAALLHDAIEDHPATGGPETKFVSVSVSVS